MKKLLLTTFNTLLLTFFLNFIAQPLRADNQKIDDLLQERSEILEEAFRVAHLRFKSGEDENLNVINEVQVEIMEVRLEIADRLEIGKRPEKQLEILKSALALASETEEEVKFGYQAGLSTRQDVLLAESWRLGMQVQLEQEKEQLSSGVESQQIDNLLQARSEILEEALRLARLRFRAGLDKNLKVINEVLVELIEIRLEIADRSEIGKRTEKRFEILKSGMTEAFETLRDARNLEKAGLGTRLNVFLAESLRLDMRIKLEQEKAKLSNSAGTQQIDKLLRIRSETLEEALRLARLRYRARAKNGNINMINEALVEFIETRLEIADRSEIGKRPEKRVEILESAVAEASETERNVSEAERYVEKYQHLRESQISSLDFLLAENWRLEMQVQLEQEREKLFNGFE